MEFVYKIALTCLSLKKTKNNIFKIFLNHKFPESLELKKFLRAQFLTDIEIPALFFSAHKAPEKTAGI